MIKYFFSLDVVRILLSIPGRRSCQTPEDTLARWRWRCVRCCEDFTNLTVAKSNNNISSCAFPTTNPLPWRLFPFALRKCPLPTWAKHRLPLKSAAFCPSSLKIRLIPPTRTNPLLLLWLVPTLADTVVNVKRAPRILTRPSLKLPWWSRVNEEQDVDCHWFARSMNGRNPQIHSWLWYLDRWSRAHGHHGFASNPTSLLYKR